MVAPFPYESVSGTIIDPAESEAENLYAQYKWLARWSDEMASDTDLDLKKLAQFVYHCRQFKNWLDKLKVRWQNEGVSQDPDFPFDRVKGEILETISGAFGKRMCVWDTRGSMRQDLNAIRDAADTLADWIEANEATYKDGFAIVKPVNDKFMDQPIKATKSGALAQRVSGFRALFGVRP